MSTVGLHPGNFYEDPQAWCHVTWGFVDAFIVWILKQGYAIGNINAHLATVKKYASLAVQAGTLDPQAYGLISRIKTYGHTEGLNADKNRTENKVPARRPASRRGAKKAQPVLISPAQAQKLMTQPNTPLGRRDALLMCILLEEGLRIGEVVLLTAANFDLERGELHFYRPKVDQDQRLEISENTIAAARAYLEQDASAEGPIWRASASAWDGRAAVATGQLASPGMSEITLTRRVAQLGTKIGLKKLSAHDCRHLWATQAVRNGTSLNDLQEAGGWNSYAMPLRYIEKSKVARVKRRKK